MADLNPEEAKNDRVAALGDEAGAFFWHLENQLYYTRMRWKCYVGLFGTNPERFDLLNSISRSTTFHLERSMWEATLLSICRMTDPAKGRAGTSEKNVTIRRLPGYVKKGDLKLLSGKIDIAVSVAKYARDFRNKKLAHSDDHAANGQIALNPGSRKEVRESIDSIAACVKCFAESELNVTLQTHPINSGDDEVELLQALFIGKQEGEKIEIERRRIAIEKGWKEGRAFYPFPDWLTFRPERDIDS